MATEPKPRRKDRPLTRKPGQPRRGALPWEPTDKDRLLIQLGVADGMTREQIAKVLGKDEKTLLRYCREELEAGDVKLFSKVSGALVTKVMKGDTTAIIWFEKTRRGMSDKTRHEHSFDLTQLTDEELAVIENIRARISPQP